MLEIKEPYEDFEEYCRKIEKKYEGYPVCNCCGQAITDEETIYYNDQYCCKDCEQYFWMDIREDFLVKVEVDDD